MNTGRAVKTALIVITALCVFGSSPFAWTAEPQVLQETVFEGYFLGMGNLLAVNDQDEVFVAADFQGDRNDILLAKIDSDGDPLWQTVVSGNEIDFATALAIDVNGDLLVAGWTGSEDFPTTSDAIHANRVARRDGFLIRVAATDGAPQLFRRLGRAADAESR